MLILKQNDENVKKECIHYLSHPGAVLLMPTETVYGLFCSWDDKEALNRICEMKERESNKPFQMLAPDLESIENEGVIITNEIKKLYDAFCPGPITIVAKQGDSGNTIGFRIPDHGFMQDLLLSYGANIAATSANFADAPPATTIEEAVASLKGEPNIAVDAGPIHGIASTVVDMTGPLFRILRKGPISESEISNILI
jgi:L-threonylcarbamoyladenylate synthase